MTTLKKDEREEFEFLEDDDEFEEFEEGGGTHQQHHPQHSHHTDWGEEDKEDEDEKLWNDDWYTNYSHHSFSMSHSTLGMMKIWKTISANNSGSNILRASFISLTRYRKELETLKSQKSQMETE